MLNVIKLKNYTSGLIVVEVNKSNTFLVGDLITEVEMTEIYNISQLRKQIVEVFDNKKTHIN